MYVCGRTVDILIENIGEATDDGRAHYVSQCPTDEQVCEV